MMGLIEGRSIVSSVDHKHNMQTSDEGQRSVQPGINIHSMSPPLSLSVSLSFRSVSL